MIETKITAFLTGVAVTIASAFTGVALGAAVAFLLAVGANAEPIKNIEAKDKPPNIRKKNYE